MLNVAEISNSTAIIPLREGQRESTGGGVNLPLPAISFVTATNEETYSLPDAPWVLVRDMFPYGLLARTTGAELRECRLLQTVAHNSASDMVLTSYQTVHLLPDETFQRRSIPYSKPDVPAEIYSQSAQAKRLREISGLTVEHLASIFGVSRITYHKWMDGSLLSDRHKEHLLEILPLIEEAFQRLGSPKAVNTWLLTPVSPGEKKPIEYLSSRQYSTFRGFLLRRYTSQRLFHPLVPSKRVYRERPREEIEEELERLNPGFRLDEDYPETFHEDDLFIIVSQPCDIQKPPVHEPYVEVMRAYKTNERSIIHEASRNSVRYFLLQRSLSESGAEEALIVESTIRLPLDKASLLHLTPLSNIQDKVVLRLFRNWLARRYDRPALDDDLVNAVQKPIVKAIDRLRPAHPLHDILDGIGEVLLLLQNDTSPYQVALLFLRKERSDSMSVSDEQAANLAEWVEGVLNKSGNAALIDWDILNTDEISLKDYTNALKLSLDQFSLHLDEHENR